METHFLNHKDKPVKGFFITEIGYKNDYDFSVYHRHNYFEIFLFETGHSGQQNIDFVEYKIQKNNLYFVTPGQVHLLNRHKSEKGLLIQFTREFLHFALSPSQINWINLMQSNANIPLNDQQVEFVKCIIEQLKENYLQDSRYRTQKISKLFAFFMFSLLDFFPDQHEQKHENDLMNAFIELVKKEVSKHRQVSYYAEALCVTVNKLGLDAKKRFGLSPLKIIHQELMLELKRQLVFEHKSHKEIAFDFCFDDLSTYNRFIKSQTGMNPTELKAYLMKMVNS